MAPSHHQRSALGGSLSPAAPPSRRPLLVFLSLLSLWLIGTVGVLSSATWFFGIPSWALLTDGEVPTWPGEAWLAPSTLADSPAVAAGSSDLDDLLDVAPSSGAADAAAAIAVAAASGAVSSEAWDGYVPGTEDWSHLNDVQLLPGERIPRIIHQTWMNDVLPEKWRDSYLECRRGLPNYTYHLWTDSTSRHFVARHYPSFLATFDSYAYPIQRADAIRYFVLHRFGGIYMDLDIGCKRDMAPLLRGDWDVVLAKTIPVGVSNDVMLASKGSAFMEMTIHGLVTFNHDYVSNYPTVMFTTGPMFLSAQYALYTASHPLTPLRPNLEIRILPKSLYGKNALPEEAPHAFFSHFYGSSWHSDDSNFILFLGKRGKWLLRLATILLVVGVVRLVWTRGRGVARKSQGGLRRLVVGLESVAQGGGVEGFRAAAMGAGAGGPSATGASSSGAAYHLLSFLPSSAASRAASPTSSPSSSNPNSPTLAGTTGGLLPLAFELGSGPSSAVPSPPTSPPPSSAAALLAFRRAAHTYLVSTPATLFTSSSTFTSSSSSSSSSTNKGARRPSTQRRRSKQGVLYFLPAFFTPDDQPSSSSSPWRRADNTGGRIRSASDARSRSSAGGVDPSSAGRLLMDDDYLEKGLSLETGARADGAGGVVSRRSSPPPIYERATAPGMTAANVNPSEEWDEWGHDDLGLIKKTDSGVADVEVTPVADEDEDVLVSTAEDEDEESSHEKTRLVRD